MAKTDIMRIVATEEFDSLNTLSADSIDQNQVSDFIL
jgi:hypothetical protein